MFMSIRKAIMESIYRNRNFVKRNPDCTNIVACKVTEPFDFNNPNFVLMDNEEGEELLKTLTPLYIQAGVQYYGYL